MAMTKHHLHWLADSIAALVVLSLVSFVALGILGVGIGLSAVGQAWFGLYSFVVLMSATKLYGKRVYNAVKSASARVAQGQSQKTE